MVKEGQNVKANQPLFVIEAMKMETTVTCHASGKITRIELKEGSRVEAEDLIITMQVDDTQKR